jgi:DNA-binding response OmpR family regulator
MMIQVNAVHSNSIVPFSMKDEGAAIFSGEDAGTSAKQAQKPRAKRILVVDDEDLVADSVAEILKEHGFDAHAAYSGKQAIDLAHERCPDILMSDVLMPRLNGVQTALAIREICPRVRVLLFSGQAGTVDILKRARSQGYDFELLPKPIHPDELLEKLK